MIQARRGAIFLSKVNNFWYKIEGKCIYPKEEKNSLSDSTYSFWTRLKVATASAHFAFQGFSN